MSKPHRQRKKIKKKAQSHPLHMKIFGWIKNLDDEIKEVKIVQDEACGSNQQIPMFCAKSLQDKSRKTQFCKVDLLLVRRGKVRVIIEIEETSIIPTQIYGKFLTAGLSTSYIHETKKRGSRKPKQIFYKKANKVLFIQVLNEKKLPAQTDKYKQSKNIEKGICKMISIPGMIKILKIVQYKIYFANVKDNNKSKNKLIRTIKNFLKT